MTNPADSSVQNLLPVQAYFNTDGSFNTFIGQGVPFYATANPSQSGLTITNSTLNSSPIGNTSPSTGVFTNIATTTGTISTQPTGATDIVNLLALQSYAAGISWKQPCAVATLANITLSGLQTIDGYVTLAGDRVLVKNQSTAANNGIYLASASTWTRSLDANSWDELISAISFIEYGTQAGGAWFCTATPGGTLGVTAVNWSQFTTSATYSAGTGLTLTGTIFSITPVGTASTYGSATQTPVFTTNASGQVSSVTNTTITPAVGSITGLGTGVATALAVNTGSAGAFVVNGDALGTPSSGTLTNCTFPVLNQNTTGYAASLAGGLAGSLPYQSAVNTTTFLAAGSNGQVLTLASGVPSWATPTTGTVTSVGGTGTVNGLTLTGTVTTSGNLTLGGTLDLSAPPAIGGTTANTIRGTVITATTNFVGSYFDASGSGGGALRSNTGTSCLQWGGGGGGNLTVDVSANLNGANAAISLAPTGTGTVTINPATVSAMNNVAIGATTASTGKFTSLTNTGLTTGRVTYATTGGLLTDSANMTFNGTTFTLANDASISGLTVGKGGGSQSTNTVVGNGAFANATSASYQSTVMGYQAAGTGVNITDTTAFGYQAAKAVTSGYHATAFGSFSLFSTTTGTDNAGFGRNTLYNNTSGISNTACGNEALFSNTTASNNTAVGYQAGYSNTTGTESVFLGAYAGRSSNVDSQTFIGRYSGYSTTGGANTFIGHNSGNTVTSGASNTILGRYNGNQGGLDIRTASNYIVLSDGDGNPRGYSDGSGNWTFTGSLKPSQTAGIIGTTTNNDANAGSVGEYVSATPSAYTVTTTVSNPTSISLTAGDWDVTVVTSGGGASATATSSLIGINTSASTIGTGATDYVYFANDVANGGSGGMFTKRISLASTTTVYAMAKTVAGTTSFQNCVLSARRVR